MLGACGGGEPDSALTSPAGLQAASYSAEVHGANGAGAAYAASVEDQRQDPAQQGVEAQVSFQTELQVLSMHGSSAYAISDGARARLAQASQIARVLQSRQTDPELADDASRERMALVEAEYEKSFSLEKNRELAERKMQEGIVEPAGQQAYVPHEDCLDPRQPECSANPQLARY